MEYSGASQDLAYDLRQRYAKIVGDQLEEVVFHRRARDYPNWFKSLEDLYTITEYKFNIDAKEKKEFKDNVKEGKEEKSKFDFKEHTKLKEELIEIANKYTETWVGKIDTPEEVAKIEKALRNIEEWIYFKMNETNMFGSKRDREGLI